MRITGLLLASLIAAAPLAAQDVAAWGGALTGFQTQQGDTRGAKDAALFGVTGGVWFNHSLGMDASFHTANIESSRGEGSGTQQYLTASVLFNFLPANPVWSLYVKAGAGTVSVQPPWSGSNSSTNKSITLLGVGTHHRWGLTGFWGAEFQMMRFNADYHEWPILFTAGWRFGGGPIPAPK